MSEGDGILSIVPGWLSGVDRILLQTTLRNQGATFCRLGVAGH